MARLEMEYAGQFQGKDPEIFSRAEIIRSEIDTDLARRPLDNAESVRGIRERLTGVDLDLLAIERKKAELGFEPPLDIVDGAARVLDPFLAGLNTGVHAYGRFFKDYQPSNW